MKRVLVPALVLALGLVFALPALAQPAPSPTVKVSSDPTLGRILTDGNGMLLYLYSRDEKGNSTCYDACEARWPILRPPAGGAPTGSSDINGTLGTITRRDGTQQVTYNDIPLYYFVMDQNPGETKGQAVGGIWWVLAPGLNQITPAVAQQPAPQPSPAAAPAAQPSPAAKPAGAPAQAPAAKPTGAAPAASPAPANLPRTGGMPFELGMLLVGSGAAGIAATSVGVGLLRRGARRRK